METLTRRRPVLQFPEWCPECNKVYLTTFEIRGCNDHGASKPTMEPDDEDVHDAK